LHLNWQQADAACRQSDGELKALHAQRETRQVRTLTSNTTSPLTLAAQHRRTGSATVAADSASANAGKSTTSAPPSRNARNWANASASGASSLNSATSCNRTSPPAKSGAATGKAAARKRPGPRQTDCCGQRGKQGKNFKADSAWQTAQTEQNQRLAGQTLAELRQHWQSEQAGLNRWQQLETLAQRRRELAEPSRRRNPRSCSRARSEKTAQERR
jgi:exonuclease SbcC